MNIDHLTALLPLPVFSLYRLLQTIPFKFQSANPYHRSIQNLTEKPVMLICDPIISVPSFTVFGPEHDIPASLRIESLFYNIHIFSIFIQILIGHSCIKTQNIKFCMLQCKKIFITCFNIVPEKCFVFVIHIFRKRIVCHYPSPFCIHSKFGQPVTDLCLQDIHLPVFVPPLHTHRFLHLSVSGSHCHNFLQNQQIHIPRITDLTASPH